MASDKQAWKDKIGHHSQLGGIETSVLDNGLGKGTRIAWFNTGSGFRFKVVLDRGMDIADAFHGAHSLAWISHSGIVAPQPFSNQGIDWLRTFSGGLLTTCGLSHMGPPEADQYGSRGLHGNFSNTAAEIISIIQPDPISGNMEMSITGLINETTVFGPSLQLKRTISAKLGESKLWVRDELANRGNTAAPHMLLYHINCGYPLIDEGTEIIWNGSWEEMGNKPDGIFKKGKSFKKCPEPLDAHAGFGEDVAFIKPDTTNGHEVTCGFVNPKLKLGLQVDFDAKQLPWLINWQHWGKGEYVTAIEPATNPPIGQAKARAEGTLIQLAPGESRQYDLCINVLTNQDEIEQLKNSNGLEGQ
jgi:hypothetical protein